METMRFAKVERLACEVDLRQASCNVAGKQLLILTLNFLQLIRRAHIASVVVQCGFRFLSESLEFEYVISGGCLHDHPASKDLGAECLRASPADSTSHGCHSVFPGKGSMSREAPPGEDSWKLVSGFLQTSLHARFPFVSFLGVLSL